MPYFWPLLLPLSVCNDFSLGRRNEPLLNSDLEGQGFKICCCFNQQSQRWMIPSFILHSTIKCMFTSGIGSESSLKEASKQHKLCVCPTWRTHKSDVTGEAIVALQGHSPHFLSSLYKLVFSQLIIVSFLTTSPSLRPSEAPDEAEDPFVSAGC